MQSSKKSEKSQNKFIQINEHEKKNSLTRNFTFYLMNEYGTMTLIISSLIFLPLMHTCKRFNVSG